MSTVVTNISDHNVSNTNVCFNFSTRRGISISNWGDFSRFRISQVSNWNCPVQTKSRNLKVKLMLLKSKDPRDLSTGSLSGWSQSTAEKFEVYRSENELRSLRNTVKDTTNSYRKTKHYSLFTIVVCEYVVPVQGCLW